ncbi:hypothetical protein ERO13_D12G002450v2 [Gossypium hirsutum]|uniref:Uncharacterized protein n=2 Tax=Gossypium TaxID=3633 RepID=A0A5J5NWD2_GOSBA|nr:hypothetical protein ES319_D12G002800v1 [Gossypium barbadense]KAG4113759.1 hypothetical protein ERO13_D12G002450v2 [Gossypium hirsutum]TYH36884.1 hypothetical protein ES332_D12G002700v1 [Gossypium tomentosum]
MSKRIIDYTTSELRAGKQREGTRTRARARGINKRKLREGDDDLSSSPPSTLSLTTTITSSSIQSATAPSSPSTLDSPTRRLKMTSSE